MPATPALQARRLTICRGARVTLDALDLAVPRGNVYALPGGHGAGKTTTLGALWVLVLIGEALARADVHSHVRYLAQVEAFEQRWRDFLLPAVMARQGLSAAQLAALPRPGPAAAP